MFSKKPIPLLLAISWLDHERELIALRNIPCGREFSVAPGELRSRSPVATKNTKITKSRSTSACEARRRARW